MTVKVDYGTGTATIEGFEEVYELDDAKSIRVHRSEHDYMDYPMGEVVRVWDKKPGEGDNGGLKAKHD